MKIVKQCQRCGNDFETTRHVAKFCSFACYKPVHMRRCAGCGNDWEVGIRDEQKFCSRACMPKRPTVKCVVCGKQRKKIKDSASLFCSRKCFASHGRLDRTEALPPADEGTFHVPLGNGKFAFIDAADAGRVMLHKWYLGRPGYAVIGKNGLGHVYLHRLILDFPDGMLVDHINLNKLDCRRANLRLANEADNSRNRRTINEFRGVRATPGGRWSSGIYADNRARNLGVFDTPEEAATAYDAAARQLHGEFARLNFPNAGERRVVSRHAAA